MLFDAQLQPAQIDVVPAEDHIQLAFGLALGLPISPDQIVPLPVGLLRFGLSKEAALKYGQELIDAANQLPDEQPPSDLVVVKSLAGVDQVAAANEQFKTGTQ